MTMLAGVAYDPAAAVSKATTALLAMTAFDTTNLRLTFTAPASGRVVWRARCVIHGATGVPAILLGVMNGATVLSRVAPSMDVAGTIAATTLVPCVVDGAVITGLTGGSSYSLDLAYGVETLLASTNIKYGGPNNTTANDAFGAITFEIWDPS